MPLCGAAPTSLCRLQREVGKRKQLKPLLLSGYRSLQRVVVHLESVFVHLHTPVTRASYFRRRCARRRVLLQTTPYVVTLTPRHRPWLIVAPPPPPRLRLERQLQPPIAAATVIVTRTVIAVRDISLRRGSRRRAGARRRGEADGSHRAQPKPVVSHADPSATHVVRSGS